MGKKKDVFSHDGRDGIFMGYGLHIDALVFYEKIEAAQNDVSGMKGLAADGRWIHLVEW